MKIIPARKAFTKWFIDGLSFVLVIFVVAIISVFLSSNISKLSRKHPEVEDDAISLLKEADPELFRYLLACEKPWQILFFMDPECPACRNTWKSIEKDLPAFEKIFDFVIILNSPDPLDPIYRVRYDPQGDISRCFNVNAVPAFACFQNGKEIKVLLGEKQILTWLAATSISDNRSRHSKHAKGVVELR